MDKKFKHDLLLRIVKTFDVFLIMVPFAVCWYLYYGDRTVTPYYPRGNLLIILLFLAVLVLFGRTYDAFLISINRVAEIFYSQSLAVIMTDAILYFVTVLLAKEMLNAAPLVGACVIQELLALLWSFGSNRWYYHQFPRRRSAIIFDVRPGLDDLIGEYGLEKKFDVRLTSSAENCIENIGMLEGLDVVFLSGIHSHDRNIILKYCIQNGIDVYVIPRIGDTLMSSARQMHLFHLPMLRVSRYNPVPEYVLAKRAFDFAGSALLLLLLSPVFLITAAAVRAEDGGPVFYRQTRLTKDGKEFRIIKFRSMRVDAEKDGVARLSTGEADERITRVGAVIRKLRIDELPQLINILKGDMSFVGPRPERPEIAALYEEEMPEFSLRLQGKAGLTGYAQVYGKYNTQPYDKLQMDLLYFSHPSLREDLRIIFATIKILFLPESTEGVAEGQTTAQSDNVTGSGVQAGEADEKKSRA